MLQSVLKVCLVRLSMNGWYWLIDHSCRTLNFVHSMPSNTFSEEEISRLQIFAQEGRRLRSALQSLDHSLQPWDTSPPISEERLIALAYFHAISIYLSGIYDYDVVWKTVDIPVPSLPQATIRRHVESILSVTQHALQQTSICGLLFLVPLRIAGARCWQKEQELLIRSLLGHIGLSFVVANTLARDLGEIWFRKANVQSSIAM